MLGVCSIRIYCVSPSRKFVSLIISSSDTQIAELWVLQSFLSLSVCILLCKIVEDLSEFFPTSHF